MAWHLASKFPLISSEPPRLHMPLLFSYGTLQQTKVQVSTFKRELSGTPDSLVGYVLSQVVIDDPGVVRSSGTTHHPIVRYTGDPNSRVSGTAFEVTVQELWQADRSQVGVFKRVSAELLSGRTTWVYVDAKNGGDRPRRLPRNWVVGAPPDDPIDHE